MYPNMPVASSTIPIPRTRRRYATSPLSSSPVASASPDPQPVRGYAHLSFCYDGSWFEGQLITEDESQYGLSGFCSRMPSTTVFDRGDGSSSPSSSSSSSDDVAEADVPFIVYDVTVSDQEDEEKYEFPSVLCTSVFPRCALLSPKLSFTTEKSYRGQRADMLIQRYLTPRLVGKNMRVCAGRMTFDLAMPVPSLSSSTPLWCL